MPNAAVVNLETTKNLGKADIPLAGIPGNRSDRIEIIFNQLDGSITRWEYANTTDRNAEFVLIMTLAGTVLV